MRVLHGSVAVGAATVGIAVTMVLTGSGVAGASGPLWPAGGYAPTCDSSKSLSGGRTTYTDSTPPKVGKVTFAGGRSTLVVPPKGRQLQFVAPLTDGCSGVDQVVLDKYRGSAFRGTVTLTPTVSDGDFFSVVGRSAARKVRAGSAGEYRFEGGIGRSRFSSFILDSGNHLVTQFAASTWQLVSNAPQPLVVLRDTRFTSASASPVRGKKNRYSVSATLQVAGQARWLPLTGVRVTLQKKTAPKHWTDVRTLRSNASGSIRTRVRATSKTTLRLALPLQADPGYRAAARSRPMHVG